MQNLHKEQTSQESHETENIQFQKLHNTVQAIQNTHIKGTKEAQNTQIQNLHNTIQTAQFTHIKEKQEAQKTLTVPP